MPQCSRCGAQFDTTDKRWKRTIPPGDRTMQWIHQCQQDETIQVGLEKGGERVAIRIGEGTVFLDAVSATNLGVMLIKQAVLAQRPKVQA